MDMSMVVYCGLLIDGTGQSPRRDAVIEISGDRISRIRSHTRVHHGSTRQELDLSEFVVAPGLIDCHEHLGLDIGDEQAQCQEPIEYITAKAVRNAQNILAAGITTVRDVGEKGLVGPSIKRAISDGIIAGPRLLVAGRNVVRTGGHGWFLGVEADGVDALRAAVRTEVARGADLIKTMASGGVSTYGSDAVAPEFSDDELAALIGEAHRRGRKVAVHAHGGEGLRAAVKLGADSVEHGTFLTDEDVQLMIDYGTYLVITTGVVDEILRRSDVPGFMKDKLASTGEGFRALLAHTRGTGLKIALGTDLNHGRLSVEMNAMVAAGYQPMEAIQAATSQAAELCGIADDVGTLEVGKVADLVAVKGDPLSDVGDMSSIVAVVKAGKLVYSAIT